MICVQSISTLIPSAAVGGDIVAGGPERPRRGRFLPQTFAGVRVVDAVVGRQQCPHRVLVVADDALGDLGTDVGACLRQITGKERIEPMRGPDHQTGHLGG